jgi:hypothetical protein
VTGVSENIGGLKASEDGLILEKRVEKGQGESEGEEANGDQ